MITVLLVDDNGPVQAGIKHILKQAEDIKVIGTATNGEEAVQRAQEDCPDVAVVDISMPVMDGIETTRHLRELCKHTHVVMLSAYDSPGYVWGAIDVGAQGYVLKEAVVDDLLAAVRALAGGEQYFSARVALYVEQHPDLQRDKDELEETGD